MQHASRSGNTCSTQAKVATLAAAIAASATLAGSNKTQRNLLL